MGMNAGSLATMALMAQSFGGAVSTVGSFYGAKVQRENFKAAAEAAETNARLSELGTQSVRRRGEARLRAATMQAGQLRGRQRASLAANGIDLGVGSASEILATTEFMKDADALVIDQNTAQEAGDLRIQAANYTGQAGMARAGAAGISPFAAGATTLLGSAGAVSDSWLKLRKEGAV